MCYCIRRGEKSSFAQQIFWLHGRVITLTYPVPSVLKSRIKRFYCRLINDVLSATRLHANVINLSIACWLFNPFTITISTRGSGEALVAVQILLMLRCLTHGMSRHRPMHLRLLQQGFVLNM